MLLAALPWLNPAAYGPSPPVIPWIASAACALLLGVIASQRLRHPLLPRGLSWACVALVAWAALTHLPLRAEVAMLAGGLLVILLAAGAARHHGLAAALQAGLLLAAVLNAGAGLLQYFGAAAALEPLVNSADAGFAFGNLRQPNQFGTLCWLGAALVLVGTVRLPRAASVALLVLFAAGGAASGSRTALLEALVLLVLCVWWPGPRRRERIALVAVTAAAYLAAVLLLPWLLEVFTGIVSRRELWGRLGAVEGCFSRRILWGNVLQLIALHPLAGWGWGELDYAHYLTLYPGPRFCDILDNAHNLPLHLAVELGLPVALLASGGALWWGLTRRPWREQDPLRQLAWTLLGLILLHNLLEYPLWYGPFQVGFGIALGWLLAPAGEAAPAARQPRALLAAALAAGLGYAAWDYARVSQIYLPPDQRRAAWADDTLAHVRRSWLFAGQARFAELTLAAPEQANAEWMYRLSDEVLHYSPEPAVIERAIESATYTGHPDEAVLHLARFRAAFPREYEAWREAQRRTLPVGR